MQTCVSRIFLIGATGGRHLSVPVVSLPCVPTFATVFQFKGRNWGLLQCQKFDGQQRPTTRYRTLQVNLHWYWRAGDSMVKGSLGLP